MKSLKNCFEPCSATKAILQQRYLGTEFIVYFLVFLLFVVILSQVVKHFIKFLQFLICFLLCLPYHLLWCASFKILRIFGMKTYGNWRQRNEIEWCFSDVVHFCFTCALLFTFSFFFFFLPLCPKALSVKNLSIQRQIDSKQRTLKWTGSRTVHV